MNLEEIKKYMKNYCGTLDDTMYDETYCTDRCLANSEIAKFISFISRQEKAKKFEAKVEKQKAYKKSLTIKT